ncbi:MAG: hypothetical protein ABW023_02390 [Sphingomonas sp.]
MKTLTKIMAAAGIAFATVAAAAPADAQRYRGDRYEQRHDRHDRWDRGHHRGWDRGYHRGWDRGRSYYRGRYHRNCWTEWRHHRRVTVCR